MSTIKGTSWEPDEIEEGEEETEEITTAPEIQIPTPSATPKKKAPFTLKAQLTQLSLFEGGN